MKKEIKSEKNKSSAVLQKVAELSGVSTGTVSRVFNNSALIPVETSVRVLAAARQLGFRPRVGVRSPQIALVTEPPHKTLMGGYVNSLTQYICFALSRSNAEITMVTEDRIDNLAAHWFDGVIGIAWEPKTIAVLKKLRNVPIIWTSDEHADLFDSVYFNHYAIGQRAGGYLYANGHRKVAVIHEADYSGMRRVSGLADIYQKAGLPVLKIVNTAPPHIAVKQLIDAGVTAVWVTGEDMKVLEINWLIQELANRKIPDDISLLGFENPGISEFQRPSLSTIYCPLQKMAETAVELVLRENPPAAKQKIELPFELIERNSISRIY